MALDFGIPDEPETVESLRSENETLRKRNEELELAVANEQDWACLKSGERDSALKARDEALDQVVVLREELEDACLGIAVHGEQPPQPYLDALSNTSALAAQRKREIQREAVEAAWHRIEPQFPNHPQTTQLRAAILGEEEP